MHRGKTIENRRWGTTFRGDFLIHAAKGCTSQEHEDAAHFAEDAVPGSTRGMPGWKQTERGGIVGIATLVDVVPPRGHALPFYPAVVNPRWHMPEQFGFVLAEVRPITFIPCKGMLGFFDVPAEVLAKVEEHLGVRT